MFKEGAPTPESQERPKRRRKMAGILKAAFIAKEVGTVLGVAHSAEAPDLKKKPTPIEHQLEQDELHSPEFESVEDPPTKP